MIDINFVELCDSNELLDLPRQLKVNVITYLWSLVSLGIVKRQSSRMK